MSGLTLNTALLFEEDGDRDGEERKEPVPPCHVIPSSSSTSPRSGPPTMLYLCKLFESLTSFLYPSLYFHCVNTIGVQPLTVVFPWMFTAFASYLKNEEVLNVWDRIIAFHENGLLLLPILSCAIFGFRKENLFKCESQEAMHNVLKDLRTIKVIPLLQHFLFSARQH